MYIQNCAECPYCEEGIVLYCVLEERDLPDKIGYEIPDWCSLEEVKGG